MREESLTVLSGGVGAARLLTGLVHATDAERITAIVNTGDDLTMYGLAVSPDVDIITYTLADLVDTNRGWGIRNDTSRCLTMLERLGRENWFGLGDEDLGVHLHRTERLHEGCTLEEVTEEIRVALHVPVRIVPMTNSAVRTRIDTGEEILPFQEYFVHRRTEDTVRNIILEGIEQAAPTDGALNAIAEAEAVIIAPSNPFVSIGPILAVPGIREAVQRRDVPVLAVSPIVAGSAIKGPAARMMDSLGHEVSALGVARIYRDLVDIMVIDRQDRALKPRIEELGMRVVVTDTIMSSLEKKTDLAMVVLGALQ